MRITGANNMFLQVVFWFGLRMLVFVITLN